MKQWIAPVIEELNIQETADGHNNGNGHENGKGHNSDNNGFNNGKGHHKDEWKDQKPGQVPTPTPIVDDGFVDDLS